MRVVRFVVIIGCSFLCGVKVGQKYSENPTIHTYRQNQIITVPGDFACPNHHVCTWKPWDVNTDKPITGNEQD